MKRLLLFVTVSLFAFLLMSRRTLCQTPESFNYQAVLRDNLGEVIENTLVSIEITILQDSATGSSVYSETHANTTNDFGLINLNIGEGTTSDDFSAIDWSTGLYYVSISVDGTEMGTNALLSVPYAKYADKAGNVFSGDFNDLINTPYFSDTIFYLMDETQTLEDVVVLNNSAGNNRIRDLAYPVDEHDAATKHYVDALYANSGVITDSRDGQTYDWIRIGNQAWMAENLNYYTSTGSWYYDHDSALNANTYGRLYIYEVLDDICPVGWHIPSDEEWFILENYLDSTITAPDTTDVRGTVAAIKLREGGSSGFNAVLGGAYYIVPDTFGLIGDIGAYWSSTENATADSVWVHSIPNFSGGVWRGIIGVNPPEASVSVRCVKDIAGWGDPAATDFITSPDDADADPTNEIQTLSINGHQLSIDQGNSIMLPDSVEDDDADPSNEIQTLGINGHQLSIENGNSIMLPDSVEDDDADATNELQVLSISNDTLYLSNGGFVFLAADTIWKISGDNVYTNSNVGIGTDKPYGILEVQATNPPVNDSILFEVKNADGQVVFGVYPEGVRINVDDLGGKGTRGGFAVGGFSSGKGLTNEFLRVSPDSVRVYIDESSGKGTRGGFAVGGFSTGKSESPDYFSISSSTSVDSIKPSESRIVWYPLKEAFLTGRVLIEGPDSVGTNSMATGYESKSIGNYSQALGYSCIARGDYSTAIGREAVSNGENTFSFGNYAIADANDAIAIGAGAQALGLRSFALGSVSIDTLGNTTGVKTTTTGKNSYAIGLGCQALNIGTFAIGVNDTASGQFALSMGHQTKASGNYSVALGRSNIASGGSSTALGKLTVASGIFATSMGYKTTAEGRASITMGQHTTASGISSLAIGNTTTASANRSFAQGYLTEALGIGSIAFGNQTISIGTNAIATGYKTIAPSYCQVVLGKFNDTTNASSGTTWEGDEPVFTIGNGTSGSDRNNAMQVLKNGEVYFPDVPGMDIGIAAVLYMNAYGQIGNVPSSARYKKNIVDMEDVSWIYDLRPVNFTYLQDVTNAKQYGLIAEEVEQVNETFVMYDKEGEIYTVRYHALISPMLKAIQELKEENEELRARIETLENK